MVNTTQKDVEPFKTPTNPMNIIRARIPNVTGALAFMSG